MGAGEDGAAPVVMEGGGLRVVVLPHLPSIVGMSAISRIEQACWAIFGKAVGLPVYSLLGGPVRDRIRLYDHRGGGEMHSLYLGDQPELMAERARQAVAAGVTAVKVPVVPRTEPLDSTAALQHAERCMVAW